VLMDGKEVGKTNMRLDKVDVETPHVLIIKLEEGKVMEKPISAADFTSENKLEVMFDTTTGLDGGKTP